MLTDQFIDSGEGRVRVSSGKANGPPLLFLHGLSRCGRDFATFTPSVASKWQIHAIDFRGHGRSARVPGKYHVADYVRDAVAVVRTLATEPVVVFGHSLGALVAAAVAAAEPEGVRAVVLEDPPGASYLARFRETPNFAQFEAQQRLAGSTRSVPEIARELADIDVPQPDGRMAKLGQLRDPTSLRFLARCMRDLDPGVYDPVLAGDWLKGYDDAAVWRGVQCPALLLRGESERGSWLPAADADRMANTIPDCTRIDVSGVGHLVHWLAPVETARYVVGFLESL
jgi:pimeloyl-ACP methyl ester carboxylesterase